MTEPIVFIPNGKPPVLQRIWMPALITLLIFTLISLTAHKPLGTIVAGELIVICLIAFTEEPVKITVDVNICTLHYEYMNALGRIKVMSFNLPVAEGYYKYEKLTRTYSGWRLVLRKNHQWFSKKITLSQNDKNGFSKAQLDEIAALIDQSKTLTL